MQVDIVIPTLNRKVKLERCLTSIAKQTYKNIQVHVVEDTQRKQAFGIWNEFIAAHKGIQVFCYLCDDTELMPDCIEQAMAVLPIENGVVGFNQSIREKNGFCQSAMGIISGAFIRLFKGNPVFCPDYRSFHADSELGSFARSRNSFYFCKAAMLIHYHPAHYKDEIDETHKLVRNAEVVRKDRETYDTRKRMGYLWGNDFRRLTR
jgi:glycosyltransferase involved in cell wall biosynthesis